MGEATRRGGTLDELGLFTGVPQHENFCRMADLLDTRPMAASSVPVEWARGPELVIPDAFDHEGRERSVERFLAETDTAALLVIHRGRLRHEQYWLTGGRHVPWMSMSVAKSFVSALVGIAVEDGFVSDIEDPVSAYIKVDPGSAYDGVPSPEPAADVVGRTMGRGLLQPGGRSETTG